MAGTFDAGLARGRYELDTSSFERAIQAAIARYAELEAAAKRAASPARLPAPSTSAGGTDAADALAQQKLATETQKTALVQNQAARAAQALATEEQRTASAANTAARAAQALATEEQRTATQTANAAKAQTQAEAAALRLAAAQQRAASSGGLAQEFAQGIKSGLIGIVGP